MIKNELEKLISDKGALIGVIGLGYVGLPLIVEFCLKGFNAVGFEVDETKTDEISAGRSYIVDVTSENVKKCVEAGVRRGHIERGFAGFDLANRLILLNHVAFAYVHFGDIRRFHAFRRR